MYIVFSKQPKLIPANNEAVRKVFKLNSFFGNKNKNAVFEHSSIIPFKTKADRKIEGKVVLEKILSVGIINCSNTVGIIEKSPKRIASRA